MKSAKCTVILLNSVHIGLQSDIIVNPEAFSFLDNKNFTLFMVHV